MLNEMLTWSIRSVVVSVRDLDRSSLFYQDVLNLREVSRENRIAVLGSDLPSPAVYLREAHRNVVHRGDALGVRAVSFDVGPITELDRVESRLRELDAFRSRQVISEAQGYEIVQGNDPDRLALVFVAHATDLPLQDYRKALAKLYAIDL